MRNVSTTRLALAARHRVTALLVLLLWASAQGAARAEPADGQKFGDWSVRCESNPAKADAKQCYIFQSVIETDKQRQILRLMVAYPNGEQDPRAVLVLPLGIDLRPGVEVKIDDGAGQRYPFVFCVQEGCQVRFLLDDALLAKFKRGLNGTVTFRALTKGQGIKVPISLKGFTAALKSLR